MRATVTKADLLSALTLMAKLVPLKSPRPIFTGAVLTAEGDTLTLRGTDLESEFTITVPARVAVGGAVVAPVRALRDTLKALGALEVDIRAEGGKVALGPAQFPVVGTLEDFPAAWLTVNTQLVEADFLPALATVAFAASTDAARYGLCGVFYEAAAARLVATDGHRLAYCETPALHVQGEGMKGDIILPNKTVASMIQMGKREKTASMALGFAALPSVAEGKPSTFKGTFQVGSAQLTFRCLDATFPSYRNVLPRAGDDVVVIVSRQQLTRALKVVAASLGKLRPKPVRVSLNEVMRLTANNPDAGETSQVVEAEIRPRKELTSIFNAAYLLDGCQHVDVEDIVLSFHDGTDPVVLTGGGLTYVVMPIRT